MLEGTEEISLLDNEEQDRLLLDPVDDERSYAENERRPWDLFASYSQEDDDGSQESKFFIFGAKILKILAYAVTFVIVFISAILSKGSLLLMTSAIANNRSFEICKDGLQLEKDKMYKVRMSDDERNGWIWCLLFSLMFPEILTFLRSIRICIFKSYQTPDIKTFFTVLVAESLHVIGIIFMVFIVFPHMNVAQTLSITSAVCFVPALLKVTPKLWQLLDFEDIKSSITVTIVLDILTLSFQICGLILWALPEDKPSKFVPIAAILVSFKWWENFVNERYPLMQDLQSMKERLEKSRYFTYVYVSIIKLILMVGLTYMSVSLSKHFNGSPFQFDDARKLFTRFEAGFESHNVTIYWLPSQRKDIPVNIQPEQEKSSTLTSNSFLPIATLFVHIMSSLLCYGVSKLTCKIGIQRVSFSLPLSLTAPVSLCVLVVLCGLRSTNTCLFNDVSPYIFWQCPDGDFIEKFFVDEYGWVWILWILSHTWTVIHIWMPKDERLASTEKLFVCPMYCSALLDQSLTLNRRNFSDCSDQTKNYDDAQESLEGFSNYSSDIVENDVNVPRVYACATMWHETADEMELLLKSIIRMDEDQCARRMTQKYMKISDPDYYYLEAHIFFDDAFVLSDESDEEVVINRFVKDLISVVDEAASKVHDTPIRLMAPVKTPTPYGGRLVWSLPGRNKLYVHLKNKDLIRHKKRWSQVMYMYYLLGYHLMAKDIDVKEKDIMAENTYILALDGDIDFRPKAVQLLLDLMKKNKALGAACGRIHPVGTGLMVYYQKFEYAIGHWLQKATEHKIGCVLCSPGCFSLFRAKALMDDNVMKSYTAKSKGAVNYIQYDQGEDRWLCTLLLQRGYRVEYCAASDAYTHCPESFAEFYTQRRRWGPSTMANILDLLIHYKKTVACNNSISMPYIAYQMLMMVGTILGPGTIFLMLVGSVVSAMGVSNWNSFVYNFVPIAFFIIICFAADNNTQILTAQILSTGYALLMMAVLVGISLQVALDGIGSPGAIFLISLACSFIVSAIMHPQEFSCILHGLLYIICVPSMYLLLTLYSMVNLHVVSWGTREVQTKKSKKQLEEEEKQKAMEKTKNPPRKFQWLPGMGSADEEDGSITFSFANLFRCMCCTYPKPDETKMVMEKIQEQLKGINEEMYTIRRQIGGPSNRALGIRRKSVTRIKTISEDDEDTTEDPEEQIEIETDIGDYAEEEPAPETRDQSITWLSDDVLKESDIQNVSETEIQFWKELIDLYLYPLIDEPGEKQRVANQLIELRNKAVFGFLMINCLFVLIVFLLQMQKDTLHVKWPLNVKANISYIESLNTIDIQTDPLKLEPINLVMVFFFMLILIIQFGAMLLHRTETLTHILASTELRCCCARNVEIDGEENVNKNAVHFARCLQKLKDDDVDGLNKKVKPDKKVERRATIQVLESRQLIKPKFTTLDESFKARFVTIGEEETPDEPVLSGLRKLSISEETLAVLKRKASTYVSNSRPSTPMSRRSGRRRYSDDDMRRLNEEFGSMNGSIRSGFSNLAFNDDSYPSSRATPAPPSPFQSVRVRADIHDPIGHASLRRKLERISESC